MLQDGLGTRVDLAQQGRFEAGLLQTELYASNASE
jgi:hypothetical protein